MQALYNSLEGEQPGLYPHAGCAACLSRCWIVSCEDFCVPPALRISTEIDTSAQKIPTLKTLQSINLLLSKKEYF